MPNRKTPMIYENLRQIKCPTLRANCESFLKKYEIEKSFVDGDGSRESIYENIESRPPTLNLYNDLAAEISSEFAIDEPQKEEIIDLLEKTALAYIGGYQARINRKSLVEMLTQITEFTTSLEKCVQPIEKDTEYYKTIFAGLSGNEKQAKIYSQALYSLLESSETLKTLPNFLKQSEVMQTVKIGKRAPVGNPALERWTEGIYFIWTRYLGRSLENLHDGVNGRKHLLRFMEKCILPIHQSIEFETLDNMLRKIQNLKANDG